MVVTTDVELTRARNFRENLRRIFQASASQAQVARDANLHPVHIAKIVNGRASNPTIDTMEAISIALEIPLETLISTSPTDVDLRILEKTS